MSGNEWNTQARSRRGGAQHRRGDPGRSAWSSRHGATSRPSRLARTPGIGTPRWCAAPPRGLPLPGRRRLAGSEGDDRSTCTSRGIRPAAVADPARRPRSRRRPGAADQGTGGAGVCRTGGRRHARTTTGGGGSRARCCPTSPTPRGAWWIEKRRYLVEEVGVDGFKTDGGEHAWGHDLRYADGPRRHGQQPLPGAVRGRLPELLWPRPAGRVTFSRAGFTGADGPGHWAGDEDSTWEAFRASVTAGFTAGARESSTGAGTSAASRGRSPTPSSTCGQPRWLLLPDHAVPLGVNHHRPPSATAPRGTSPNVPAMHVCSPHIGASPRSGSGSCRIWRRRPAAPWWSASRSCVLSASTGRTMPASGSTRWSTSLGTRCWSRRWWSQGWSSGPSTCRGARGPMRGRARCWLGDEWCGVGCRSTASRCSDAVLVPAPGRGVLTHRRPVQATGQLPGRHRVPSDPIDPSAPSGTCCRGRPSAAPASGAASRPARSP